MTKADFLASLRNELRDISTEEREDALKFYSEYFDDAGVENEQSVISELGSPERVAGTIRANCVAVPMVIPDSRAKRDSAAPNTSRTILIVILLLLTFPLWVGIAGAGFGILISIFAVVFSLFIAGIVMCFAGVICFFAALAAMSVSVPSAILSAGVSLIIVAVGAMLIGVMSFLVGKGIPAVGRGLGGLFKGLFGRRSRQ